MTGEFKGSLIHRILSHIKAGAHEFYQSDLVDLANFYQDSEPDIDFYLIRLALKIGMSEADIKKSVKELKCSFQLGTFAERINLMQKLSFLIFSLEAIPADVKVDIIVFYFNDLANYVRESSIECSYEFIKYASFSFQRELPLFILLFLGMERRSDQEKCASAMIDILNSLLNLPMRWILEGVELDAAECVKSVFFALKTSVAQEVTNKTYRNVFDAKRKFNLLSQKKVNKVNRFVIFGNLSANFEDQKDFVFEIWRSNDEIKFEFSELDPNFLFELPTVYCDVTSRVKSMGDDFRNFIEQTIDGSEYLIISGSSEIQFLPISANCIDTGEGVPFVFGITGRDWMDWSLAYYKKLACAFFGIVEFNGYSHQVDRACGVFVDLPGVLEECNNLKELFGPSSQVYIGDECTFFNLERTLVGSRCQIVHISSHAVSFQDDESSAFIVLSNGRGGFEKIEFDKIAFGQFGNVELLVLASCSTFAGKLTKSEGVFGLGKAFLMAGAKSVLASRWPVDDVASTIFFRKFYSELKNGVSVLRAMVEAQKCVRGTEGCNDPYYWAGWQLLV